MEQIPKMLTAFLRVFINFMRDALPDNSNASWATHFFSPKVELGLAKNSSKQAFFLFSPDFYEDD